MIMVFLQYRQPYIEDFVVAVIPYTKGNPTAGATVCKQENYNEIYNVRKATP